MAMPSHDGSGLLGPCNPGVRFKLDTWKPGLHCRNDALAIHYERKQHLPNQMTSPPRRQKKKLQQGALPFRHRGGSRDGAGRNPKGEKPGAALARGHAIA
jgi:hypothetical protein